MNYETDGNEPRVVLTDEADNETLQFIISNGQSPTDSQVGSVGAELAKSYMFLQKSLASDLRHDPFKRLGKWTEFITHKLYFAVFIHPTPASAYQVFEVINTRGRDLTTADLLKNFTISQSAPADRELVYQRWKRVSDVFQSDGSNFLQYIRHAVTVENGHILSKNLFSFLASRSSHGSRIPPTSMELLNLLEERLPLYLQMMDPSLPGPAADEALGVFEALNRLNVITVRPLMMAIFDVANRERGLEQLLRLVTQRIVVGNLGTGNIERRFADAARRVHQSGDWLVPLNELSDLSPEKEAFRDIIQRRTLNKGVLLYLKNAICARRLAPVEYSPLHFIIPKATKDHPSFSEGELSYWGNTVGNTFLSTAEKRLGEAEWKDFKRVMLPKAASGEFVEKLNMYDDWNAKAIKEVGQDLADIAVGIWYD